MDKRRIPRYPTMCEMVMIGGERHSVMSTMSQTGCGIEISSDARLEESQRFQNATCEGCRAWLRYLNPHHQ